MTGLREQKKQATKEALQAAALRLALEHGPENVRVDDIADAAGVSPRTYNNYFSSREQAIIAAVTADRASRLTTAVTGGATLAEGVTEAMVTLYQEPSGDVLLLIMNHAVLRARYVDDVTAIAAPLAEAITARHPDLEQLTADVLAAAVSAATKLALSRWLHSAAAPASMPGFVIPAGSLPELIRSALRPLVPALDAAGS